MSSRTVPPHIDAYTTLPLSLPGLPSSPSEATHFLYLSRHQPKISTTATDDRSLFLANIPFDTTDAHIKSLFAVQLGLPAGRIEHVNYDSVKTTAVGADPTQLAKAVQSKKRRKRNSEVALQGRLKAPTLPSTWNRSLHPQGSTAVVVFVDRSSMEAVIKAVNLAVRHQSYPTWGKDLEAQAPQLGLQRYLAHQQLIYPDPAKLLDSVNQYMTAFAARESEQARLRAERRQEPDEEGFVTVTRGGRTHPATQETAQLTAKKHKERQKGLDDFYRFQARERKKAKATELMKRFEEDKEKLRTLRTKKRGFVVGRQARRMK